MDTQALIKEDATVNLNLPRTESGNFKTYGNFKNQRKKRKQRMDHHDYEDYECDSKMVFLTIGAITCVMVAATVMICGICLAHVLDIEARLKEQTLLISVLMPGGCPNGLIKTDNHGCLDPETHYKLCHENGGTIKPTEQPRNGVSVECSVKI